MSAMVACGAGDAPAPERPLPDQTHLEMPVRLAPPALSAEAIVMQEAILETTKRDSLRRFSRLADKTPDFVSNFEGSDNFDHWSLLRRTGVDPLRQIEKLFEGRHGVRTIGSEVWYIWPYFAAMSPDDLLPEQLDFQDKARLLALVGPEGLAHIRAGGAYPGYRTAISQSGRWVYYLHESGETEVVP